MFLFWEIIKIPFLDHLISVQGSWVYIAKTGNFTCPYTYLIKYLEAARIPSFSQNFIFRSLWYDKNLKSNVLSSKPLTPSRAGEILKEKLKAIG